MILYTENQIFDLIGAVSCAEDLAEIEHYVLSNKIAYRSYDVDIWLLCINDLHSILNK